MVIHSPGPARLFLKAGDGIEVALSVAHLALHLWHPVHSQIIPRES